MRLSIITVNLNNCDGLQKTIDSVICQTFHDYEWIVIDGGSTDGSKELIEQYADHFAYWVSEPDKGIYNAMNKGVRIANGEYIQFLNSGDWLCNNDTLALVFGQSTELTTDIIYGTLMDGLSWSIPHHLTLEYFFDCTLFHQSTFTRKQLLLDTPFDEKYQIVSDRKFFIEQLVLRKASYQALDLLLCYYQDGGICCDQRKTILELDQVFNELFPPMVVELIHDFMSKKNAYMRPYYEYIDNYPRLAKWIRRVVRIHKRFHSHHSVKS